MRNKILKNSGRGTEQAITKSNFTSPPPKTLKQKKPSKNMTEKRIVCRISKKSDKGREKT